jgi:hypothetical protein
MASIEPIRIFIYVEITPEFQLLSRAINPADPRQCGARADDIRALCHIRAARSRDKRAPIKNAQPERAGRSNIVSSDRSGV